MNLPDGYRGRVPTSDDLVAVAEVLQADDVDDSGKIVLDEHFVHDEWSRVGFDLAVDAWVVTDTNGTIVGYGQAALAERALVVSWGVVHPEHRGRGIGSAVLHWIEMRASQQLAGLRSAHFRHAVNASDPTAAALLAARGLRPIRHFWHMQIDLQEASEPEPAAEGILIAGISSPGDLRAVHAVLDDAFADHWGHEPEPFDRWTETQTASPSHDTTLWLLATDDERPVGALTANVWGERGWIDSLGVLAPYRGRGIGAALLRRSFATFADRGVGEVALSVDADNPTGATTLYERAGMRVVWRWDLWERPWVETPGPSSPANGPS